MIKFTEDKNCYRVWHIPQIPGEPFHIYCSTIEEAIGIIETLSEYDKFQLENNIKGDYANMNGVEVFDDCEKEWLSWHHEDVSNDEYFDDIWDYIRHLKEVGKLPSDQ